MQARCGSLAFWQRGHVPMLAGRSAWWARRVRFIDLELRLAGTISNLSTRRGADRRIPPRRHLHRTYHRTVFRPKRAQPRDGFKTPERGNVFLLKAPVKS